MADGEGTSGGRGAELRTFLIADVRGYTTYTREHGDEAAAELAMRFAETVNEVVAAREGFLVELRGDEALVVFTSARQGLRAAVELQQRFEEIGLPRGVGIGLDAGEAVPVEDGYRGGALNLAARLCSQAQAGQVLASEGVIHLAAKVDGLAYVDPRNLRLKGYDAPVRAIEVVPSERTPRPMSLRLKRARRGFRSHRALVAAIALGVVMAVVAAIVVPRLLGDDEGAVALPAGISLLRVDDGEVVSSIGRSEIEEPAEVIYRGGSFWVLNLSPLSFIRVSKTGTIEQRVASPVADVGFFDVDGDDLWVADYGNSDLVKVDLRLEREVARYDLAANDGERNVGSLGLVVADGAVWVGRHDPVSAVLKVDAETGEVTERFDRLFGSGSIAAGDGAVWSAGGGGVYRIDVETGEVVRADLPAYGPGTTESVTVAGGSAWVANETTGELYKLDQRGEVAATYRTGQGARTLSFWDDTVWVASQDAGTLAGVGVLSGERTTFRFHHPVQAAVVGDGVILTLLLPGLTWEERLFAEPGDVARLFVQPYLIEEGDPAMLWNPLAFVVANATCLRLLNHPDAPAPEGWELVPEAATALPEISADGRTYTFHVRDGFAFSPPSNEPVTAETFRASIERALSPALGDQAPGPAFIDDIEGEDAFREGTADHISGLQVEGDALSITLVEPSGDFLERLAMPFFCPVPLDTPVVPNAVSRSLGQEPGRLTVAAAGPYYLADAYNGEYAILRRNPNYAGPRVTHLDAIALREGVDPGVAASRVEDEGWHGITNMFHPLLDPGGALDERWGPSSDAAADGDQRYFLTPQPVIGYLAFDTGSAPFADPDVRRAASLALDRASIAAIWRQIPTDQILPSNEPGFEDHDLYALDVAALDEAEALMDGRRVSASFAVFEGCEVCLDSGEIVRSQLAEVGIDVEIVESPDPLTEARDGADYQILDMGTVLEYPDPASFLHAMFLEDLPVSWVPGSVREEVAALQTLEGDERIRAANELADRLAADVVPVAAYGANLAGEYLSPDLGCRVFQPSGWGIDLAALCLE